jgi:dihydrofolate reductase
MRKSGEVPGMSGTSSYVVSRRWKPGRREGFEVVNGPQGKIIYLGGGGELCRSFLQEDLVDELFIGVSAVL